MIFHSLDFVAFLIVTLILYWRLPILWQNRLLLVASYLFYGWIHPWFVLLIVTSTTIDYWAARWMEAWPGHKRAFLALSVITNLGMLGFFKYSNFFIENVAAVFGVIGLSPSLPSLRVILPVGISFFTFQALSYTIDVYRGRLQARRSFVDVATFVALFPQLVAGPIERASALLPQIERPRRFSIDAARTGLLLVAWGYFKKLVVADNVGVIANKIFSLQDPAFEMLWVGVLAFGLQIYADFSAYSDIARGVARWLGIELMVNFDQPYLSRGPQQFWRRWHVSLSTWFRDYVYIPLGGSRHGFGRELVSIMATFLLSGFWHGASWNFVLWGLYHGLLVVGSRIGHRLRGPMSAGWGWLAPLRVAATFVLVQIGWLMFRETELTALVRDFLLSPADSTGAEREAAYALFLMILPYAAPVWLQGLIVEAWRGRPGVVQQGPADAGPRALWLAAQGALVGLLLAGILVFRSRTPMDFIYFRF
jgi:alginate O-acetyltransferase complex protein AlgI